MKELRIGKTVCSEEINVEWFQEGVDFADFGAVVDYPISIEELKNIIEKAESDGANFAYIGYHEDHQEYEFDFVSIK